MEGLNLFTIMIAFVGGLASFLSPCVLPLVPGYISLISGVSVEHLKGEHGSQATARRAVVFNSLAFNAGLSLIFLLLGAAAGAVGAAIISNRWVRIVGGLVIIAFGLQLMGVLKIGALYRDTRKFSDERPRGMLGSLPLGLAFAAGWTPCIGPILGGILGLAATSGGWKSGLILSAFYAAGLAVPFLLTGLGINKFLGFYSKFRKHLHKVEVVSGVMLVSIGLLIATNKISVINSWLASWLPNAESAVSLEGSNAEVLPPLEASEVALAPEIELKDLKGAPIRLSDLKGRVVFLNFWATWCVPCRTEIPEINAMYHDLEPQGLTVVGASWDDSVAQIQRFQQEIKVDYPILLDAQSVGDRFGGIQSYPTTFIIDRQGRIRYKILGKRNRATFEAAVKLLLSASQSTASSK